MQLEALSRQLPLQKIGDRLAPLQVDEHAGDRQNLLRVAARGDPHAIDVFCAQHFT